MAELLDEKFYLIDQLLEVARMDRIGMPTGLLTHAVVNKVLSSFSGLAYAVNV